MQIILKLLRTDSRGWEIDQTKITIGEIPERQTGVNDQVNKR